MLNIYEYLDRSDTHIAEGLLNTVDKQDRLDLLKLKASNDKFRKHLKTHEQSKA